MNRTIFYSWQSDLPNSTNRGFIQQCLENALKKIKADSEVIVSPAIDRDTIGKTGSPDITDTIFSKISAADIFVADVTLIPKAFPFSRERRTPNPNVLVELGYAIKTIGWDRIILVQNLASGGIHELPFDIRSRRVIGYSLSKRNTKSAEKNNLTSLLSTALKTCLENTEFNYRPNSSTPIWFGQWGRQFASEDHGGKLIITSTSSTSFNFYLAVHNGSHRGQISGRAVFSGSDIAYARFTDNDSLCEIKFHRQLVDGQWKITIEESGDCFQYHGMRAYFNGKYIKKNIPLFDLGYLDEIDLCRIYDLLDSHFNDVMMRFPGIHEEKNLDSFGTRVYSGSTAGLSGVNNAIIMCGEFTELYIAYLQNEKLIYFTNDEAFKTHLPKTIENWKKDFYIKCVIVNPTEKREGVVWDENSKNFQAALELRTKRLFERLSAIESLPKKKLWSRLQHLWRRN